MMLRVGLFLLLTAAPVHAQPEANLLKNKPLTDDGDLSVKMLDGAHRFAERKIEESVATRAKLWKRDSSSPAAYERSIRPNRDSFRKIIGVADPRLPVAMERFGDEDNPSLVADAGSFHVYQVRWPVLNGVYGEGLFLEPSGKVLGHVIALPDADQTPEQIVGLQPGIASESQFARRLAANGFRIIVPTLISRACDFSGNPRIAMTNQSHREWIYRQAYQMGRHVIGYELQKILTATDWIKQRFPESKIGIAGYGEGGLIAFYAAAIDTRLDAVLVSGYFGSRQRVWEEPIERNIWGLLNEFGDAEIATLVAPRGLIVEHSEGPPIRFPLPVPKGRRGGGAVGKLGTPRASEVGDEWKRIDSLVPHEFHKRYLVRGEPDPVPHFMSAAAVRRFAQLLGIDSKLELSKETPRDRRKKFDAHERQRRQVKELESHVQGLVRAASVARDEWMLNHTTLIRTLASRGERFRMFRVKEQSAEQFAKEVAPFRKILAEEVIGKISDDLLPPNPKIRKVYDHAKWTGYEVMLDVFPDVFAWGVLLVPKGIKESQKRPVVVCQHGRNGLPKDVIEGDLPAYHNFAAKLAERGFITFAPHNLYRGEDRYRMLNRKGSPVKLSMFSFIAAQHQQILNWLGGLPFIDANRIAFYGLSYGGETAMRVPALLTGYCLSICSGDFNDWARKVASTDSDYSFMFTIEWEMPYFNMGSTFNYAEMAYLIAPRPFMVERGHHDGVAPDEWVASEYAKVRWVYDNLGLADRTALEFFNGGHTINGEGTFDFLHRHLRWPKRTASLLGSKAGDERKVRGVKLCWCPPGKFTMGSPRGEPERRADEAQVEVTLTKGFWMGKYEVTQGQWKQVMGKLPGELTVELPEGDDFPVGNVNYTEAEQFCSKLTEMARKSGDLPKGWEFRLPTEAQWEYACRAGTKTATAFGDKLSSKRANFQGKPYNGAKEGPSLKRAAKVGSYSANAWGLHDMHGNIYEWCRDWYHEKLPGGADPELSAVKGTRNRDGTFSRVRRGGAWCDDGWACRSAFRLRYEPERRYDHIGFRVAVVPQ